jgi:hypothetical protein
MRASFYHVKIELLDCPQSFVL